ncbi:MAG: cytochrome c [Gemmatimonadetes bacterium]|nr:cytochrome c [Gemmatimonadota bacterium]
MSRLDMNRTRRALASVLALGAMTTLAGCSDWAGYDLDMLMGKVPWLSTMRKGVQIAPYENPRLPAVGTIPVENPNGDAPPAFTATQLDSVAAALRNPYPVTPRFLERGELQFQRNCSVCHGPQGAGNGPVVGPQKFPFAPAINSAATAARSDGYIYGVIRVGRGLMPSYGERMTDSDRWAVVTYVRHLQGRSATPAPTAGPQVSNAAPGTAVSGALDASPTTRAGSDSVAQAPR